MGSKTRKLRQQAGVAGREYQANQRREERKRERRVRLQLRESAAVLSFDGPGGQVKSGQLAHALPGDSVAVGYRGARQSGLLDLALRSGMPVSFDDVGLHLEHLKQELVLALAGDITKADRLTGAIVRHAQTTVDPNHEVIARGLRETILALRDDGDLSKVSALRDFHAAPAAEPVLVVEPLESPLPHVAAAPTAPARSAGAPGFGPPIRPERRGGKLGTVLALAMLLGMGGGLKGDDHGF